MITETPLFINSKKGKLFAVIRSCDNPKQGVIVCPPIGEEQKNAYGYISRLCRLLAEKGMKVVSFDYSGTGDSEGEFYSQVKLDNLTNNIHDIYRHLLNEFPENEIGIVAFRLSLLPILSWLEQESAKLDWLTMWSPVIDGKRYINEVKRQMTISQIIYHKETGRKLPLEGLFITEGYSWSKEWGRTIEQFNARDMLKVFPKRNYIFNFTHSGKITSDINKLAKKIRAEKDVRIFNYATLPFWKNIQPDEIVMWRAMQETGKAILEGK